MWALGVSGQYKETGSVPFLRKWAWAILTSPKFKIRLGLGQLSFIGRHTGLFSKRTIFYVKESGHASVEKQGF